MGSAAPGAQGWPPQQVTPTGLHRSPSPGGPTLLPTPAPASAPLRSSSWKTFSVLAPSACLSCSQRQPQGTTWRGPEPCNSAHLFSAVRECGTPDRSWRPSLQQLLEWQSSQEASPTLSPRFQEEIAHQNCQVLGHIGLSPHLRWEKVTLVRAGHFEDVMKCLYWPWALSAMALKYRVNLSSQILETQAPPRPLNRLPTIHKAGFLSVPQDGERRRGSQESIVLPATRQPRARPEPGPAGPQSWMGLAF